MSNQHPESSTSDSTFSQPLNLYSTSTNSFLTSTKEEDSTLIHLLNGDRRRAIIPTPNRPTIVSQTVAPTSSNQTLTAHHHLESTDFNSYKIPQTLREESPVDNVTGLIDNISQTDNTMDINNFDSFILEHFVPFSGKQSVHQWLDETERTFQHLKVPRNLRFEAISLLVEGNAKRLYIQHRKDLRSFDDFYEFLLSHFDTTNPSYSNSHSRTTTFPNTTNRQSPSARSTAIVDFDTTHIMGELPAKKSTYSTTVSSCNALDQTQQDLRKAIVSDLIKNPKTFKGAKDDVQKWIEDIEHLLDIGRIPESSRLDLIAYLLRGDALQWYKTNQELFTSWTVFIQELKRAFTSSFYAEIAFKRLESYHQGENQSIRNFFNEVLKLCKETDSTMSEATKLKTLLSKTKPSIQLEVRKKKPISTAEFLEYAKDAEELFQLSDVHNETNSINTSHISKDQTLYTRVITPSSNNNYSPNSFSNKFSSGYSRNLPNNSNTSNRTFSSGTHRNMYQTPTYNSSSFRSPQFNHSSFPPTNSRSTLQGNKSSFHNHTNNNRGRFQSRSTQPHSSNANPVRTRTANTIYPIDPLMDMEFERESLSSEFCIQCNEYGHDETSCPHFY